ncbi:nucleotidyltransferase domain-containing protein [Candidatus Parcubacteria bacterium]|nr:nucleotidyltransferase domain-containing protein [Candidatus Parcubacteria bacterium]
MINFRSQITKKVLSYFLLNTGTEMYVNEMAEKFSVDRGNLTRKLSEWEKEGILEKRKKGNLSLYKINKKYLFLSELKKIIQKSFGIEKQLQQTLKKINKLKTAVLFGSYVKNKLSAESDIDLLLIGSHNFLEAQKEIVKLQKQFDREINTIDMTETEFKNKKNSALLKNIFKNKHIKLI